MGSGSSGPCSCSRNSAESDTSKELECSRTRSRGQEYDPVHFAPEANTKSPRGLRLSPRPQNQAPETTQILEAAPQQDAVVKVEEKPQADSVYHELVKSADVPAPKTQPNIVVQDTVVQEAAEKKQEAAIAENQPAAAAETNGASQGPAGTLQVPGTSGTVSGGPTSSPRTSPRTSPRGTGEGGARWSEIGTASTTAKRKSWFTRGRRESKTQADGATADFGSGRASIVGAGGRRRSLRERLTGSNSMGSSLPSKPKSGNLNIPLDYMWLADTLVSVTRCEAHTLGVVDLASKNAFTPLFFCVGGCPNSFCGMQAIMFSVSPINDLDFWWVKPIKGKNELEKQTLMLHSKGPHKNDPGRSKAFYKPLGDLFGNGQTQGGIKFGIEVFEAKSNGHEAKSARAYLEKVKGEKERRYLTLIWQEDWTANPLAWSKYIKGKLIYQKDLNSQVFNACDYAIVDGKVTIGQKENQSFKDVLPGNWVKDLEI